MSHGTDLLKVSAARTHAHKRAHTHTLTHTNPFRPSAHVCMCRLYVCTCMLLKMWGAPLKRDIGLDQRDVRACIQLKMWGTLLHHIVNMLMVSISSPETYFDELFLLTVRHIRYGVRPDYLPPFGRALLETFQEIAAEHWYSSTDVYVCVCARVCVYACPCACPCVLARARLRACVCIVFSQVSIW
jgi:hypothetical protein